VSRPLVCVQGLGFVGTAMALAVASARDDAGEPAFDVVGVELDSPEGREKAAGINRGELPISSVDPKMGSALREALEVGNLRATTDPAAYEQAAVAVVDIQFDVAFDQGPEPSIDFTGIEAAVRSLATRMPAGSLILVETTVPPGTCEKVLGPLIDAALEQRGMAADAIMLAHSYERVMPGADYLDSIVNFWRVYAGRTAAAADACEVFLARIVSAEDYPMSRLASTTASEMGKVLENSYRATNIAFIEEWGRFAEAVGVDLFEVIDAIRVRPTHSNMRQPGFGVGGYCLPKDPLFPKLGAHELFGLEQLDFPFSERAVRVNRAMPLVTVEKLDELLGGLRGKRLLLLGLSYREGVGDTRFSPSSTFLNAVSERGGEVVPYDPIALDGAAGTANELPDPAGFDAVVFAVGHTELVEMDVAAWLGESRPLVFDASRVLSADSLRAVAALGCPVWAIGRGEVEA
jgi:UDP-N-acetyl-D-glucosamine dehydrogenase